MHTLKEGANGDFIPNKKADKYTDLAVNGLYNKYPKLSVKSLNYYSILIKFLLFFAVVFYCFHINSQITLTAIIIIVNVFYFLTFFAKSAIFLIGIIVRKSSIKVKSDIILEENKLPIYSILIPLYKEKRTIENLLKSIYNFDYPLEKLDVKILLEEDDLETIEYVNFLSKKYKFDTIIVPNSLPRTKPKACNYGLQFAKGELITIYDAEDRPDKYQLKKVITKFIVNDKKLACIQAGLNYYNRQENLLTKMFSIEYSLWFDFMIKGLDFLGLSIPLGGTSNHLKTEKLREIGGWDAFNVTEDADLGVRIARFGYLCSTIDSETKEEAPFTLKSWIKQRSRWIKGYIQTYFVHMQNPVKLFKELGLKNFIGFQFAIGSTFFIFITLIPMFILSILIWTSVLQVKIPEIFNYISFSNLISTFIFMIFSSFYIIKFRKWSGMILIPIIFPFYWILHCFASLKSLSQLIFGRAFYWEKTEHGKSKFLNKNY
jgi:cellulose synthase/poly-beta-1,6-N-acetylglucosamine synthase-like glycosyltransferase